MERILVLPVQMVQLLRDVTIRKIRILQKQAQSNPTPHRETKRPTFVGERSLVDARRGTPLNR